MTVPIDGGEQESLRELAARVIDNGRAYFKAEMTLAKERAITGVKEARITIVLLLVVLMLAQGAILALAAALGLLLAHWLGMPGGFALAGLLMIGTALLLTRTVVQRIRKIIR